MRFLLLTLLLVLPAVSNLRAQAANSEYIIVTGGPSLIEWEKYKAAPHDRFWANFVRASRYRIEQLRKQYGPSLRITWLVYKPAYVRRSERQDKENHITNLESVRDKYGLNLVWLNSGPDVINYLNRGMPRDQVKISGFEYFGHSNSRCFLLDYSNEIDSGSKAWVHEDDLKQIQHGIFDRKPTIKSWGCHTGESMSKKWYAATGTHMIGAIGKTQFMMEELPILISEDGRWVN